MSILGALQAGVSALGAQSTAMAAVSDNIANMNTVGYKTNNVSFSTLVTKQVASSKYSAGGVQAKASQQIDAQGLLSSVSSSTALAVSGSGYFVVNSSYNGEGVWAYTRAGDFKTDETGHLVNTGGYYVQGWSLMPWDGTSGVAVVDINGIKYMKAYKDDNGQVVYINDNIVDERNLRGIDLSKIGGTATATTQISFGANLPSGDVIGSKHGVSTLIYDSLGNASNISLNFIKSSANSWTMDTSIPSGAAAINMYTDTNMVYSSIAQMEFTDIPAEGSIIEIDGKKFEFVTDGAAEPDNIMVDISKANSVRDVLDTFVASISENIRDAGRFVVDGNAIVVRQSVTGNKLTFNCSGTLACVQSSAKIDRSSGLPAGTFNLEEIDPLIKNFAYIDFNNIEEGDSLKVNGIEFIFGEGDTVEGETYYLGYNASNVVNTANLVGAIQNSGVAEPERFVASGFTMQILPSSTGPAIEITDIDITDATDVSMKNGQIEGDMSNITSNFIYDGVKQIGNIIPAVMFNSDGTPKTINVNQMEVYWANGAQDMTGDVKLGDGVRIRVNMGEENLATGLTTLSGGFATSYINQDGATFGSYSGVTVGEDGVVTAVFSNGETRPISIIPLAMFTSANGMEALNNNVWIATTESGNPLLTTATTGGAGEIVASSLESSTVDLATEFSNMVIVQRAYSAAGKIITTSDEMLQELTNLI